MSGPLPHNLESRVAPKSLPKPPVGRRRPAGRPGQCRKKPRRCHIRLMHTGPGRSRGPANLFGFLGSLMAQGTTKGPASWPTASFSMPHSATKAADLQPLVDFQNPMPQPLWAVRCIDAPHGGFLMSPFHCVMCAGHTRAQAQGHENRGEWRMYFFFLVGSCVPSLTFHV